MNSFANGALNTKRGRKIKYGNYHLPYLKAVLIGTSAGYTCISVMRKLSNEGRLDETGMELALTGTKLQQAPIKLHRKKLNDRGCDGSPDWIIEIVSPSTSRIDYGVKLFKYRTAGVREYWIVNPMKKTVTVFDMESEEKSNQYDFRHSFGHHYLRKQQMEQEIPCSFRPLSEYNFLL